MKGTLVDTVFALAIMGLGAQPGSALAIDLTSGYLAKVSCLLQRGSWPTTMLQPSAHTALT